MNAVMRTLAAATILLAGSLLAPPATAGEHPHDATAMHSFADVEHWTAVFDDPARDAWQKPEELVAALGLRPGMRVADLGAGTGYLEHRLSAAVGPRGAVLAIDTEPALVEHLRARAEKEHLDNVTPILASTDLARIPARSVDLVLILDTYHHIGDRLTYLAGLGRALRPDGRIAIVDWQKRELPVGPGIAHKLARAHVVGEMEEAGYQLAEEPAILPYQYFLVFRPKPRAGRARVRRPGIEPGTHGLKGRCSAD